MDISNKIFFSKDGETFERINDRFHCYSPSNEGNEINLASVRIYSSMDRAQAALEEMPDILLAYRYAKIDDEMHDITDIKLKSIKLWTERRTVTISGKEKLIGAKLKGKVEFEMMFSSSFSDCFW